MKDRGLIPTYVHGILDYVAGLALVFAPNIFGFAGAGGAAEAVPRVLGVAVLLMALLTDYELGLIKLIPFKAHKTIDIVAGIYLALSPWIHGFSDLPANAWVPHVIVGAMVLIISLLSQSEPSRRGVMRTAH